MAAQIYIADAEKRITEGKWAGQGPSQGPRPLPEVRAFLASCILYDGVLITQTTQKSF